MEDIKDKNLLIEVKDDCSFCFRDGLSVNDSSSRSPKGYVKIFSIDKDGNKVRFFKKSGALL